MVEEERRPPRFELSLIIVENANLFKIFESPSPLSLIFPIRTLRIIPVLEFEGET